MIFQKRLGFFFSEILQFFRATSKTAKKRCHKKVDFHRGSGHPTTEASFYKPIALLNSLLKLYDGLLAQRLASKVEDEGLLSELQGGFRWGRGQFHQQLMVRETVLRARAASAKGKPVYAAFLDLKKAFDSVPRNIL